MKKSVGTYVSHCKALYTDMGMIKKGIFEQMQN